MKYIMVIVLCSMNKYAYICIFMGQGGDVFDLGPCIRILKKIDKDGYLIDRYKYLFLSFFVVVNLYFFQTLKFYFFVGWW